MLAAIALAFAAEGNDGDAIGARARGGERGQRTPDARLRERPHAAFGGDLDSLPPKLRRAVPVESSVSG